MKRLIRFFALCGAMVFLSQTFAHAQKQKLEPEDYGQWQQITTTELSADGQWFAYNINLVDGDGWLNIKEVGTDSTGNHKFMHGVRPDFSNNNKWAAFLIGVSEDKAEKLEKQKKPVRYKLGLMNLSTAEVDTFEKVQSYRFSDDGNYLAMKKYQAEGVKTDGSDLILRNLSAGTNQLIGNVAEYGFNDGGTKLAVLLDANEQLGNGVHLYDLASGKITVLDSDTNNYKDLTWDEDGSALAFLKTKENDDFKDPTHQIYAFKNVDGAIQKSIFDQQNHAAFPDSMRIVDYRSLEWSEDNNTVFFGIKQWDPKKSDKNGEQDTTKKKLNEDLDPSNVEVWHWQDDDIIPKQEVMAGQLKRENHFSAWHLDDEKFVQLGSEKFEQVELTGDQQHAVAYNPKPYEPTFEEEWRDVYIIDVANGNSKKILDRHEFVQTSPDGNYLLYFKDQNWWTYDIGQDQHQNITENIDTRFQNFTNVNGREHNRPFGSAEWSADDSWMLLYDQYNTYKVWADGSNYQKLTRGGNDKIRYRQTRFEYDNDGIKEDESIYFSMYGDKSKDRGYARLGDNGQTQTLIYEPKMTSRLSKADSTRHYVYQVESATDSPDFFHVDHAFSNPVALTNTNPQQDNYYWLMTKLLLLRTKMVKNLKDDCSTRPTTIRTRNTR